MDRTRGRGNIEAGFEEALVEHLRTAPWWLASAGVHAAGFLLLGMLIESDSALAREPVVESRITPPEVDLDPELKPDILRHKPIVQPLDAPVDPVLDLRDVEPDVDPIEAGPVTGDPRLRPGPFEGMGDSAIIGPGGGAGGGLGGPFTTRTGLKPTAPKQALDATDAALDWLVRHQSPDGR